MVWHTLPKPFLALAPMEDVTDTVFRRLLLEWGTPHVFFSEFTRADRAARSTPDRIPPRLVYSAAEKPIIAQIWGNRPADFSAACRKLTVLGFDGIDINMGCPAKKIRRIRAGAALIGEYDLAASLISACRESTDLPVSVKTRTGTDRAVTEPWCEFLLRSGIDALTVHGRTATQMSTGFADWRELAKVVRVRDRIGSEAVIIGNGDVMNIAHAHRLVEQTGVDGIMIGRAVFRNPFVFSPDFADVFRYPFARSDGLAFVEHHARAFREQWNDRRNFESLKKFFRNYVNSYPSVRSDLEKLYATHDYDGLFVALEELRANNDSTSTSA